MGKVTLSGYIDVPATDLCTVEQELPRHIELTRNEPGCEVFDVRQDENDLQRFYVYEVFTTESDFLRHQQRVQRSYWGEITKDVERHYKIDK